MSLPIAFSPCPNDTFIFHSWVHKLIPDAPPITPHYADVEELNKWALEGRFPVSKVSFGVLPLLLNQYELLPSGSALGYGCGPKLVASTPFPIEELPHKKVAIPGEHTTANLLLDLLLPPVTHKQPMLYSQIAPEVLSKKWDAGLIIHETRFTLEELGLHEIADLGALWEAQYKCPTPLGCIVVKRDLPIELKQSIAQALYQSISYGFASPERAMPYILQHAQELSEEVVQAHIDLYVNEETLKLSPQALQAIERLLEHSPLQPGVSCVTT